MDKKYYPTADAIRIIAGIGVITIHTLAPFLNYPPFFQTITYWLANLLDSASKIAVPLFVLVSGFLLLDETKVYTIKTFFTKRLTRLGIPILVWPVFYFLWDIFYLHHTVVLTEIPQMIISMSIYYHLYFLYLIFGLYLITPILAVYNKHASRASKWYFLLCSFLFSLAISFVAPGSLALSTIFTFFLPYIPYFFAGRFLADSVNKIKKIRLLGIVYILFVVITALSHYYVMLAHGWNKLTIGALPKDIGFDNYISPNIIVMSLIVFAICMKNTFIRNIKKASSVELLKVLSGCTFGVYLIHPMILDLLDKLSFLNLSSIHSPVWVFMFLKLFLAIIFSYITVYLVRKIKFIKLVFGN